MKNNKELSIETIIKKYQNRQEKLLLEINQENNQPKGMHELSSTRHPYQDTSLATPHFNHNNSKESKTFHQPPSNPIEKTHKKSAYSSHPQDNQVACISFEQNDYLKIQHEKVLKQLSDSEQKLIKSERGYADIWRKYEKLLHDKQYSGLQVQIQQKLRRNQTSELQTKIHSLQRQLHSYKQLLNSKENNIVILKEKVQQKSEKLLQQQKQLTEMRSFMERRQLQDRHKQKEPQKSSFNDRLTQELQRLGHILIDKQNEKKSLLQQLQKAYVMHKQEIQVLKLGYLKVQQQYKEWIQQVSAQKIKTIEDYELKLKQYRQKHNNNSYKILLSQQNQEHSSKKQEQTHKLYTISIKQTNQIKILRSELQNLQKMKSEFIIKISFLQNNLVSKNQLYDQLEKTYSKLKEQYHLEEQRHKDTLKKYNGINKQFLQLKNKCKVMFQENEVNKGKSNDNMEIIRIRKQLMYSKQQLQKSKNSQFQLNHRFTETVSAVKNKLSQLQSEKEEINTDLLAERLQNIKLKQELQQTKQYLKKEYQLSLKNTKRQLQKQLKGKVQQHSHRQMEVQKENLYLNLRELERRYELMNSEVVTKDDMINIAHKVYKRNELYKK